MGPPDPVKEAPKWCILKALQAGGTIGLSWDMLMSALVVDLPMLPADIDRELRRLEKSASVRRIKLPQTGLVWYRLTAQGREFADEYSVAEVGALLDQWAAREGR